MRETYKHTQIGFVVLALLGFGILAILGVILTAGNHPIFIAVLVLLLACVVVFPSMTIEIRDGVLAWCFGPGFIRKSVQVTDIENAEIAVPVVTERITIAMRKFLQYSVHLFVRPRVALRALLDDPKSLGFGFLGPVALAAVYFFRISIGLAMNAMHLPQSPVLKIPAEQYYAYERFFILPVGLAGIILASGVIRLLAQGWNGQGRFEDLFTLLGFGQIVVAVVMGLPDLAIGILAGVGISVPNSLVFTGPHIYLGTLWCVLLTILAVKEVEHLSWGKSIVLALMGFVVNGVVQFIFIR
ncbi:MAG: YIP1 family protein [Chloroflexota bacterium]